MWIISGQWCYYYYYLPRAYLLYRYLQQLVTAQGTHNRELEQELKAYRQSSELMGDSDSPKLNNAGGGYQQ